MSFDPLDKLDTLGTIPFAIADQQGELVACVFLDFYHRNNNKEYQHCYVHDLAVAPELRHERAGGNKGQQHFGETFFVKIFDELKKQNDGVFYTCIADLWLIGGGAAEYQSLRDHINFDLLGGQKVNTVTRNMFVSLGNPGPESLKYADREMDPQAKNYRLAKNLSAKDQERIAEIKRTDLLKQQNQTISSTAVSAVTQLGINAQPTPTQPTLQPSSSNNQNLPKPPEQKY